MIYIHIEAYIELERFNPIPLVFCYENNCELYVKIDNRYNWLTSCLKNLFQLS